MNVFLMVPTNIFEQLKKSGHLTCQTDTFWRGYTTTPTRRNASLLSNFSEEDGTLLMVSIPDEECTVTELSKEEKNIITDAKCKAILFPELCLSFIKAQQAFLNKRYFRHLSDATVSTEVLTDLLLQQPNAGARYKAMCIVAADDHLGARISSKKCTPSECAELSSMIDEILEGSDGEEVAAELGTNPYGNRKLMAFSTGSDICRRYLELQSLAAGKIDEKAEKRLFYIAGKRITSHAPISVSVRNAFLPIGSDLINGYRVFVSHRSEDRLRCMLKSACYVLRTREEELTSKGERGSMVLTVKCGKELLATATWEGGKFHIVDEVLRAEILRMRNDV